MLKKISLALACSAFAFSLAIAPAQAATKKPRPQIKNNPDIYTSKPDLPADVPYTNKRDRSWLGGYLGGGDGNSIYNGDGSVTTSPPPRRRNGRDRRWRRGHQN